MSSIIFSHDLELSLALNAGFSLLTIKLDIYCDLLRADTINGLVLYLRAERNIN